MALSRAAAPVVGEPWHALDLPAVAAHLRADLDAGLSAGEVRERLARVGPNRVGDHPETPLWRLALAQFRSLVVLLLLAGALVAWVLGERVEALAILAALVLNAAIGFASEWRARISMARLRALAVSRRAPVMARIEARRTGEWGDCTSRLWGATSPRGRMVDR